ncbi:MAG: ribonuclease H-like YkuK family protein [Candidatus Doudnabacteria bacterium]|nr:ribonuclease H-like YkuK family protein [Candidatus Doudnabacteria bacterium]
MLRQEVEQQQGDKLLFFNKFVSPTHGPLNFTAVLDKLLEYLGNEPGFEYELIVGTDSMPENGSSAEFVSAIVVHRKKCGGIYFWTKQHETKVYTLRQRIYQEALHSIKLAEQLITELKLRDITEFSLTIHVDIGPNGQTKQMLQEIVGMVRGNGFVVKTKPDSYGASSVADRHT